MRNSSAHDSYRRLDDDGDFALRYCTNVLRKSFQPLSKQSHMQGDDVIREKKEQPRFIKILFIHARGVRISCTRLMEFAGLRT